MNFFCTFHQVLFLFGSCREAISAVCERRGVDVDSINVYLEQSRTPLPLLTTETAWLGGRHIRIRGKDGLLKYNYRAAMY